jgi:hypothetical protein
MFPEPPLAKRVADFEDIDPACICYWRGADDVWLLYFPKCCIGHLARHHVVEHEDGTITVSPSIIMPCYDGTQRHGFLERGSWRDA